MQIVNTHEAKTHLSRLLAEVEAGHDVLIARDGKPIARLTAVAKTGERILGRDAGRVAIADDFDAPLPADVLQGFGA